MQRLLTLLDTITEAGMLATLWLASCWISEGDELGARYEH